MSRKGNSGVRRGGGSAAATETQNTKKTAAKPVETAARPVDSFGFTIDKGYPELDRTNPTEMAAAREFQRVFKKLERGQTFVNIPEMRNRLNWEYDKFDGMIMKLRTSRVIQLYATEVGKFNPKDFFYDEDDNSRMGMVSWDKPL